MAKPHMAAILNDITAGHVTSHDLISDVTSFKMAAICGLATLNLYLIRMYQGHDGVIPRHVLIRSPRGRSAAQKRSAAIRSAQLGIQNRNDSQ